MVDYTSLTVAQLKKELKYRGIVQAGLRLKVQFVVKLVEDDLMRLPDQNHRWKLLSTPLDRLVSLRIGGWTPC
ncbi:hypothetical protein N7495_000052 [Penicillium taxi]|uniref:uncharacterized protein n=1 Tax=Penicillium taxi TaxID=168475 RepID=UPI00254521CF|nr:uncharacterized protein N7495_000052 [Penicillium taxi]KAJ5907370.1 hypothetical protein N7495_000052 [Penicillium taxi]